MGLLENVFSLTVHNFGHQAGRSVDLGPVLLGLVTLQAFQD
jgi:hypothetical protein